MESLNERSDSSESSEIKQKSYDLVDAFIYKLAHKLGGRSEVVDIPLVDALAYLIIVMEEEEREAEEKSVELYMSHLSRVMSNPAQDNEQADAQQDFMNRLEPRSFKKPKKLETDYAKLDQLIAAQEAQMKQLN